MTREVTKRISIFHTEAQNLMKQKAIQRCCSFVFKFASDG